MINPATQITFISWFDQTVLLYQVYPYALSVPPLVVWLLGVCPSTPLRLIKAQAWTFHSFILCYAQYPSKLHHVWPYHWYNPIRSNKDNKSWHQGYTSSGSPHQVTSCSFRIQLRWRPACYSVEHGSSEIAKRKAKLNTSISSFSTAILLITIARSTISWQALHDYFVQELPRDPSLSNHIQGSRKTYDLLIYEICRY